MDFIFLIGLGFLFYFSYADLKASQIENKPILAFILAGLVISLFQKQLVIVGLAMGFIFGLGYCLWKTGSFGGADTKILPGILPFFSFKGIGEVFAGTLTFLLMIGFLGLLYGFIAKIMLKRKKKCIPFLPVITLAYVLTWIIL